MTVVSNWQIISSKNRRKSIRIAALILTAALFLTGVTPSFAADKSAGKTAGNSADNAGISLKSSAKISWEDAPAVEATTALVMDAGSGEILYEKNAYEKRDMASMTKIMTCLVVLETMELDEKITVDFDVSNSGTSIDIKEGETFTVEQLLYALMLPSANDAALVLAKAAGGSIENFCEMMNERALRCGAEDTNFTNPNGLNEPMQPEHRTTAYDMALMTKEAMKNDTFRKIVSTVDYTIPATSLSKKRSFRNSNRCLSDGVSKTPLPDGITQKGYYRYEGTIGVKTGYTSSAGSCFCGWAKRDNTDLIVVVMNSSSYETRFEDAIALWDYAFSKYYTYTAAKAGDVLEEFRVKHGEAGKVAVTVSEDLDITLNKEYKGKGITTEITPPDEKLEAPVKKGDEAGSITVYKDGKAVVVEHLYVMRSVEKGGILSYIGISDEDVPLFLISLAVAVILLVLIIRIYKKSKIRKKHRLRAKISRNARRREWEKEKNPFD